LQLLAKESLAAHTVESGQESGLEQLLRRDARTPFPGIELVEQGRKFLQHLVHATLDHAQGMISGHAGIEVYYRQKFGLSLRFSAHADLIVSPYVLFKENWSFSTTC
jgi:hypothetical protein